MPTKLLYESNKMTWIAHLSADNVLDAFCLLRTQEFMSVVSPKSTYVVL